MGALLLVVDLLLVGCILVWPLDRSHDRSDAGNGQRVVLPPPRPVRSRRTLVFFAVATGLSVALLGFQAPSLRDVYAHLLALSAGAVVHQPGDVTAYTRIVPGIIPASALIFSLAFGVALRASWARRAVVALHGVLATVACVASGALLTAVAAGLHLAIAPYFILSLITQMAVVYIVALRICFTTFALPRATPTPILRAPDRLDNAILIFVLLASLALVLSVSGYVVDAEGFNPAFGILLILLAPRVVLMVVFSLLWLVRLTAGSAPVATGDRRPALDVIVPAYNEELNIGRLLRSIDAAAAVYGGPVRVIVCDDGSTDRTRTVAEAEMARFAATEGRVVSGSHAGKARALNTAFGFCEADIVVRIDADCAVDDHALVFTVPWFERDPAIGAVGAFTLPHQPLRSWIQRMRTFELCYGYGFTRPSLATVDCMPLIPGTYCAFRRGPAEAAGGFVEGMNGEDVALIYDLSRLGYRAQIDPRVLTYEDAPTDIASLREQRIRWDRGTTQSFARYAPWVAGFAGPRFWFAATHATTKGLTMPVRLVMFLYVTLSLLLEPSYRRNIASVAILLVVWQVVVACIRAVMGVYRGQIRPVGWLGLWYPFTLLKRIFWLEALMTLPTRPVGNPARGPMEVAHELEPSPGPDEPSGTGAARNHLAPGQPSAASSGGR